VRRGAAALGVALGVWLCAPVAIGPARAQETLRAEIGRPLKAAEELIKARRYKEALAKVQDAEAVPGRSAHENFVLERMRMAAASGAGDVEAAVRAFEALSGSDRLPAADRLRMIESIAGAYYRDRDYARAAQWAQRYLREGGGNAAMRSLLVQSQYLAGDYAAVLKELGAEIQAAERSGAAPAEDRLKLMLNAALKAGDNTAYVRAMEKLVAYHPKQEYWAELLGRLQRRPGFSDRLSLDAYRLALATGSMRSADDYMEMAQLALQAGMGAEAEQVLQKGFASGTLGKGPQAERHHRLPNLVATRHAEDRQRSAEIVREAREAKDGNDLLRIGMDRVYGGEAAQGLQLMQQGIAKGDLKRPEDARLHLGIAYLVAGDPAKALATLKTVAGNDGTGDLARLWSLYARRKG
jgi:hypothetical protein